MIILCDILIASVKVRKGQEEIHIMFKFHQPNCNDAEQFSTCRSKELSVVVKAHHSCSWMLSNLKLCTPFLSILTRLFINKVKINKL